jgi:hypothetical protein
MTFLVTRSSPKTFILNCSNISSSLTSSTVETSPYPALFIRTSIVLCSFLILATAFSILTGLVISNVKGIIFG